MTIELETIKNGVLLKSRDGLVIEHFSSPEELFTELLSILYGRSEFFGGKNYGAVKVSDKPLTSWTSPQHDPA